MSASQLSVIINVIGKDRTGLVEELAREVSEAGGNWEGSRMARLSDQFAGMVEVVIPETKLPDLKQRLDKLDQSGLHVEVVAQGEAAQSEETTNKQCRLEVVGQDRQGIVSAISSVLAAEKVNVIEFDTHCEEAPMTGERIFRAEALVSTPESLDSDSLRERLEEIASDLLVEIDWTCSV